MQAGTLIFTLTIVVWAAAYFPGDHSALYHVESQLQQLEEGESDSTQHRALLQQQNVDLQQQVEDIDNARKQLEALIKEGLRELSA